MRGPRWLPRTGAAAVVACALAAPAAHAQVPLAEHAARRAALATQLGDGVFIARGAVEPVQDYNAFYQSPGFLYLTGYREAAASLVMTKQGADVRWTLFVEKKVPAVEVWSGTRNGPARATQLTGIAARASDDFPRVVDSLLATATRAFVLTDLSEGGDTLNRDDTFVRDLRERFPKVTLAGANEAVAQLRARKSAAELELLRKSIAISMDAHREAMRAARPGMNEFELQALVEYTFRRNGAERPSYASIVGSAANSTTLHYNRDDRFMQDGEIVVMDVGALYRGYAADVTRSFPVNGRFTPDQRAIYQVVRDAQAAAERNARPGMSWRATDDSARRVIAQGLARLGLIESPEATYDCGTDAQPRRCPQVGLYYMHGLSHGIGLEVHDPEQFYNTGTIAVGSAFTIEPGIYVRENLLDIVPDRPANRGLRGKLTTALPRFANIGVRIEDDYLVTEQGLEWASCGLPREADEVEALMRDRASAPAPRDTTRVNWYRTPEGSPTPAAPVTPPTGCRPKM